MKDKIELNFKVGRDDLGEFFQHSLGAEEIRMNISKNYYEKVDELMIQNMPEDIFEDLAAKIKREKERRSN